MKYELKALSFGDTIGKAFNMYIDNFVPLFSICFISNIPLIFLTLYFSQSLAAFYSEQAYTPLFVSVLFYGTGFFIISAVQSGIIINFIAYKYLEKEIRGKEFLNNIKSCILPIFGLSLLVGIIIGLGFILLIIPGIIFSFGLILSTQVLVIEKKGIFESMQRSWTLTKGKRFRIFGFLFIIGILSNILNQLSEIIMKTVISSIGLGGLWIGSLVAFFVAALTSPLQACLVVLIYFNSRIEREGFAVEHLANQFSIGDEEESFGQP